MSTKIYRIHPGIGVARLGNSPDEYFIGPEAPGIVPAGLYRDAEGRLKRQGARFRVYEYESDDSGRLGKVVREITGDDDATIRWTVHLANTKASAPEFPPNPPPNPNLRNPNTSADELNIDAGSQSISGSGSGPVKLSGQFKGNPVILGHLRTDQGGQLVVLGGRGKSSSYPSGAPLPDFANNPDWHDDVSDGPVRATVQFEGKEPTPCDSAWLIVAPPSYAPAINNVVTLWDQALNVAVQMEPSLRARLSPVSFTRDIYPILERTVLLQWVSQLAHKGHGPGTGGGNFLKPFRLKALSSNTSANKKARWDVYKRLRRPGGDGIANMPRLHPGLDPDNPFTSREDQPAQLTSLQLELMHKWENGQFTPDWQAPPPVPPPFQQIPMANQPLALDKAALDACIGGPFWPGIEAGYIMARKDTYRLPFRINDSKFLAGSITAGLACPWQADFKDCGAGWWPAQRPDWVIKRNGTPGDWMPSSWTAKDMVDNWSTLRFVLQQGNQYVEKK